MMKIKRLAAVLLKKVQKKTEAIMSETKENFFTKFLNEKLIPFSAKVSQNKDIQSIGQGSMGLMANHHSRCSLQPAQHNPD